MLSWSGKFISVCLELISSGSYRGTITAIIVKRYNTRAAHKNNKRVSMEINKNYFKKILLISSLIIVFMIIIKTVSRTKIATTNELKKNYENLHLKLFFLMIGSLNVFAGVILTRGRESIIAFHRMPTQLGLPRFYFIENIKQNHIPLFQHCGYNLARFKLMHVT